MFGAIGFVFPCALDLAAIVLGRGGQLLWARAQQWLEWEAGYVDPEGSGLVKGG